MYRAGMNPMTFTGQVGMWRVHEIRALEGESLAMSATSFVASTTSSP